MQVQALLVHIENLDARHSGVSDFRRNGRNAFLFYEHLGWSDNVCDLYTVHLQRYINTLNATKKVNTVRNYIQYLMKALNVLDVLQRELSLEDRTVALRILQEAKTHVSAAAYSIAKQQAQQQEQEQEQENQEDIPLMDANARDDSSSSSHGGVEDEVASIRTTQDDHLASIDASLAELTATNQTLASQLVELNRLSLKNNDLQNTIAALEDRVARYKRVLPLCFKDNPHIQAIIEALL